MSYRYLDDVAIADVAFEARGTTLEEMLRSAGDALTNVMVDDLSTIRNSESIEISVEHSEADLLLFNFLNELIFYKDARLLLLRVSTLAVHRRDDTFLLKAVLQGERIDIARHHMNVDVKAVTLHRLSARHTADGWIGTVVLDI